MSRKGVIKAAQEDPRFHRQATLGVYGDGPIDEDVGHPCGNQDVAVLHLLPGSWWCVPSTSMRWKDLFKAKASAWHNWRNDMTRFIGEIKDDAYAEAPEDDACHIGFLSSSRYCLGTKRCTSEELQVIEKSKAVWLPVYAYVHSGSTISTKPFSCLWDSGQSGIAWMAYEDALLIFGEHKFGKRVLTAAGRAKAEEYIRGTVECFDKWLTGEACGWVITDTQTGEEVDSCWGYYDRKDCEQQMMEELARHNQDAEFMTGLAAVQSRAML